MAKLKVKKAEPEKKAKAERAKLDSAQHLELEGDTVHVVTMEANGHKSVHVGCGSKAEAREAFFALFGITSTIQPVKVAEVDRDEFEAEHTTDGIPDWDVHGVLQSIKAGGKRKKAKQDQDADD